jgi:putative heme-binding domain-containing protein
MRRGCLVGTVALACVLLGLAGQPWTAGAQQASGVQWIWFNEGDPAKEAPAEVRYFRLVFTIDRPVQKPVDEAALDLTADSEFTAWVNGVEVGKGNNPKRVYRFDVQPHLVHGPNVIAVAAKGRGGPAGLLVRLGYVPNGQSKLAVVSNGSWLASRTAAEGWQKVDFSASGWSPVRVLGPYGRTGPWKDLVWDAGGDDRFSVPPGFRVEKVADNPNPADPFSLVNLTFDARGRLLVSQENGAILLCTHPDADGVFQSVKPYCEQVRNSQGMCWVHDALLLVGDGEVGGKKVTGLYRVRDTDGDDKTDEVRLLHAFRGGMGEHGPHAIFHGPDDWLYLVIGNHAWAQPERLADNSPLRRWPTGQMGPDQGQPGTTEDVLLPRQNDSRGHAADIRAPGGTIWRLDHHGRNFSLVAAGFRNQYDAAFDPAGELFTFDSDMEWDEGLPWYRAVRVCHCPPGADFVWRTGSANTPDYYLDSLPPVAETGRGSPVGVEFYDHSAFPETYRGAFFMADWAIGVIFAVHLERAGASYRTRVERFCQGAPMNVTDCAVGPEGGLYFTMGGRRTQGGVYRIVYRGSASGAAAAPRALGALPQPRSPVEEAVTLPQPLAAFARARAQQLKKSIGPGWEAELKGLARDASRPVAQRRRALDLLQQEGPAPDAALLVALAADKRAEVRAQAITLLGVNAYGEGREVLLKSLTDADALVRRRACEALVRARLEPPVEAIWPLLGEADRFVRTAARLVVQRIDPTKWVERLWKEKNDRTALEGIVALCKTKQAAPYAEPIFNRLHATAAAAGQPLLDFLRTVQLALVHTQQRPGAVKDLAGRCYRLFPHQDGRVNRELAILLTHFRRTGQLAEPVHAKLLDALLTSRDDRPQQIHYFYCLRLLHEGWTLSQKMDLVTWFERTQGWTGGHSFTPFLENILRDAQPIFTVEDRTAILAQAGQLPWAATALLQTTPERQLPPPTALASLYERLAKAAPGPQTNEMKDRVVQALARSAGPQAVPLLRRIGERDPAQRDAVARGLARFPTPENWAFLVRALESPNPLVLVDVIAALRQLPTKPKAEDPAPYRSVLLAGGRLPPRNRWNAVQLLRHWGNKDFGGKADEATAELEAWARWFAQSFPKEPPLPNLAAAQPVESKYKYEELLAFVEKDATGQVQRGRVVFEKANCLKCHKYGKEGEGIGPDLTTVSKRFKRADILEALYYPSKVISDQYRATVIVTKNGVQLTGLAAPQGDTVTVLQSDGTKVTLRKDEIEQQFASLISNMPEKLLDLLTREEIADLFAFLESEPK